MAARRRPHGGALAREIAEGLSRTLEALRAGGALEALEAEVDIPAALVARKSRRYRAAGIWALRVSAAKGREPSVRIEKHEAAAAA